MWDGFCNCWLFKLWRAYFHYEWILEERVDPNRKHIYAELPHGIFPWGEVISISITKELFPGSKVGSIGASVIFHIPYLRCVGVQGNACAHALGGGGGGCSYMPALQALHLLSTDSCTTNQLRLRRCRHFFSWIGCRPASPKNIKRIFDEGCDCAITVGGVAEMFLISGEEEKVYLKKHKGFVREAIKNGADLVPVFCYGNSRLFSVLGENSRGNFLS